MPELPEVETVKRGLETALRLPSSCWRIAGQVRVDRRVARSPERGFARLAKLRIAALARRGKFIRIELADGANGGGAGTLIVHLGMAGKFVVAAPEAPLVKHTYARFMLAAELNRPSRKDRSPHRLASSQIELRYVNPRWAMGGIWFTDGRGDPTSRLGPDPLEIGEAEFIRLLERRRQIKALLLDQEAIAGVGNIYADEALFAAGIHPQAIADSLSGPRRQKLLAALVRVLNASIAGGGSTIRDYRDATGKAGLFQLQHKVYGRDGQPCPSCAQPIRRIITAGRSTHLCPRCQKR